MAVKLVLNKTLETIEFLRNFPEVIFLAWYKIYLLFIEVLYVVYAFATFFEMKKGSMRGNLLFFVVWKWILSDFVLKF